MNEISRAAARYSLYGVAVYRFLTCVVDSLWLKVWPRPHGWIARWKASEMLRDAEGVTLSHLLSPVSPELNAGIILIPLLWMTSVIHFIAFVAICQ
jgi:hypothetical protein